MTLTKYKLGNTKFLWNNALRLEPILWNVQLNNETFVFGLCWQQQFLSFLVGGGEARVDHDWGKFGFGFLSPLRCCFTDTCLGHTRLIAHFWSWLSKLSFVFHPLRFPYSWAQTGDLRASIFKVFALNRPGNWTKLYPEQIERFDHYTVVPVVFHVTPCCWTSSRWHVCTIFKVFDRTRQRN